MPKLLNNSNHLPLPLEFYVQDTVTVARELLGKYLIYECNHIKKIGKIVETEAYPGPPDIASHTYNGKTKRNAVMYGRAGVAYVYMIYGLHHCFNIVTGFEGQGSAVLIRAIEPVEGIDKKTAGPGLLTKAYDIDLTFNGVDLLNKPLYLLENQEKNKVDVVERPRIGINYAKQWAQMPWRFYIRDNIFVSKK